MTDKEKKILETFKSAIPNMTEQEKDRLLAFGEGMALIVRQNCLARPPGDARPTA